MKAQHRIVTGWDRETKTVTAIEAGQDVPTKLAEQLVEDGHGSCLVGPSVAEAARGVSAPAKKRGRPPKIQPDPKKNED